MPAPLDDHLSVEVIDALAADLARLELPPHGVARYRRPLIVYPSDCPLLAIWPQRTTFAPRTTNWWRATLDINIVWWEEAVEQVKTLIDNPEWSKQLINVSEAITDRIISLSQSGSGWGIKGGGDVLPIAMDYQPPPDIAAGLVEGYALLVRTEVNRERLRRDA